MNRILSLVRRCVEDYDMIQPDDRVAVGVSGGKDSLTLLVALAKAAGILPHPFYSGGLHPGHGGGRGPARDGLFSYCPVVPGDGGPLHHPRQ